MLQLISFGSDLGNYVSETWVRFRVPPFEKMFTDNLNRHARALVSADDSRISRLIANVGEFPLIELHDHERLAPFHPDDVSPEISGICTHVKIYLDACSESK